MNEKENLTEAVTIRMSPLYLKALNLLVEKGIYSSRGDAIREGLRLVFKRHNLNLLEL